MRMKKRRRLLIVAAGTAMAVVVMLVVLMSLHRMDSNPLADEAAAASQPDSTDNKSRDHIIDDEKIKENDENGTVFSIRSQMRQQWPRQLKDLPSSSGGTSLRALSPLRPRIINGNEAPFGRFPYMVELLGPRGYFLCGGSLVAPDVVLSAAHCSRTLQTTHVGRWDRSNGDNDFSDGAEVRTIVYSYQHPRYRESNYAYDFQLLKLDDSVASHAPVHLNAAPDLPATRPVDIQGIVVEDRHIVTVIGFGATSFDNLDDVGPLASRLQVAELFVISNDECDAAKDDDNELFFMRVGYKGRISPDMLCAEDDKEAIDLLTGVVQRSDSCFGDSGGPMILKNPDKKISNDPNRDVQVGVVSWGFECAHPDFPGVYARVSHEYTWLRSSICALSNDPPDYLDCAALEDVSKSQIMVTVTIVFDDDPQEIAWSLMEASTRRYYAGGTTVDHGVYSSGDTIQSATFLPTGKSYLFSITDMAENGFSTVDGIEGSYSVTLDDGTIVASGQGDFGAKANTVFHITGPPTVSPTESTIPSPSPTQSPTLSMAPSSAPTITTAPTSSPSSSPSLTPSSVASVSPSQSPSVSMKQSQWPSFAPSDGPSSVPTVFPTPMPTISTKASQLPSLTPTDIPSTRPTELPSNSPTVFMEPSNQPSSGPSAAPSQSPSLSTGPSRSQKPSESPPAKPTTSAPSWSPTIAALDGPSLISSPPQSSSPAPSSESICLPKPRRCIRDAQCCSGQCARPRWRLLPRCI